LKILLYLPHEDAIGDRLLRTIEGLAINKKIEIYRKIYLLTQRLTEPTYDIDVSILMIPNKKQLTGILLICELLRDIKTILILPDRERDTISRGHELYPRFVSYIDSDFNDLGAILENMVKNKRSVKCKKIQIK
jgi:hypothetical protein